jgi:hypothetical protein
VMSVVPVTLAVVGLVAIRGCSGSVGECAADPAPMPCHSLHSLVDLFLDWHCMGNVGGLIFHMTFVGSRLVYRGGT